ncbi:hypothetical protein DLD77_02535 [Chitinophaga alhagiae]|uniref:FecR protein domain-containing protein n=1 Tax=Chitinophaga alhagiae TaxID=2203219 RepID=A0ABM6W9S5_9BACT|nr:FecR domain-containing protein [Chitinophaga alhagiae]AWO00653.1 hypothetical protein DLD77_02535 [Chitinophaga alhagiae]
MSQHHSARIRELYEKIQQNTATPEELRLFLELTEKEDQQEALPFQEWEQAHPRQLPPHLQQRILRKAAPRQPLLRRLLPYAAAAAVLLVAVRLLWPSPSPQSAEWLTASTGDGEIRTLRLPDSSVVTLNARSSIRYNLSATGAARTVYLQGQAFFDVRQNQERPFVVHSGELSTQVLGTSFDIKSYPREKPRIAVLTGKVKVADPHGASIVLAKGEQASYNTDNDDFSSATADPALMSNWQQGIINMNNLTLQEVSAVLERWYSIRVVLETPGIGNYMLSGTQANTSLNSTLESICFIFQLQYTQDGNTVRIRKK